MSTRFRFDTFVIIILSVGLILRLALVAFHYEGISALNIIDDSRFYGDIARRFWRMGLPYLTGPEWAWRIRNPYVHSVGPVYPTFLHIMLRLSRLFQTGLAIIPYAQAMIDTGLALMIAVVAHQLFGQRVGRVALLIQVFDPRYMYNAGVIQTELLYMVFVVACLIFTYRAINNGLHMPSAVWAGVFYGLAALTRPIMLMYIVVPLIYVWWHTQRRSLRYSAAYLATGILVITPWVVRTSILTGELTPIATSGWVHLWRGSREDGHDATDENSYEQEQLEDGLITPAPPTEDDNRRYSRPAIMVTPTPTPPPEDEPQGSRMGTPAGAFVQAAVENIVAQPLAYVGRILGDLGAALAQPYTTLYTRPSGVPGVRETINAVQAGEASPLDVVTLPGFVPRILIYVWHYGTLIIGTAGIIERWRRGNFWRTAHLTGWVAYVLATSAVLLVEPRYLFPMMPVFTVFAAYMISTLIDRLNQQRQRRQSQRAEYR